MIEYKSTSASDSHIRRVSSAHLDGQISLTWLWEIIVRTKRLPDDLDPKVLFFVLRDRLKNPEREVRQHALRVLADLIPIIERDSLDKQMEFLLPDFAINLSHVAPAVRKGTIDVLRVYLKHTIQPNDILKRLMTIVPDDNHLKQGLLMSIPHIPTHHINEDTLIFLLDQLFGGVEQEFLRETSIRSLVKIRSKLGVDRFNNIIGSQRGQEFQELCQQYNLNLKNCDDNVILETKITLETGPAITMQIHEEQDSSSFTSNDHQQFYDEYVTRSPRKVHFGGEVVKMRTPESDSNQQSSDDNEIHTSVIIERPTNIKITVSDNVAIKTRHRSMIPVRITSGGSNPSTPRKRIKTKRLHKSAPELGRLHVSKIPLRNEKKPGRKRDSGREEQLSPIPVHNEIEMFHNLTRSPVCTEDKADDDKEKTDIIEKNEAEAIDNTFPSFQVCDDDAKEENLKATSSKSPLEIIVDDLIHKEDTWTKSRALDDLVSIMRKNSLNFDSLSLPQLMDALFKCEKQTRLQNRAQEALSLIISAMSLHSLQEMFGKLCNDTIKMAPPIGVKLAVLIMKRSSPRSFFNVLKQEAHSREASLQALIAATRTFPRSEIDLEKGVQLVLEALEDNKRAVRQAALEAMASLAQVAGNSMILEAMREKLSDDDHLWTVIRTRLSRRQLPTVDPDGSVKYSSPREQEEFDWLCGGSGSLTKTSSLTSINYWKHNLRHDVYLPTNRNNERPGSKEQVWTGDGFSKIDGTEKGLLCPVYVLHPDGSRTSARNYRNFDRGRSNSPSGRKQNVEVQDMFSDINGNKAKRFFRQNEQFRKSFSSEYIYSGNVKYQEPSSISFSSRSSTTSTGSSGRSGLWLRDSRSGIPIPISSDSKLKLRTNRYSSDSFSGPLVAQENINKTKLESPEPTPVIRRSPSVLFTPQLPPASSGSESSGYFTPPAEHHLKDQVSERFISEEQLEENNNFSSEPNFQIVESETSESHERDALVQRQLSASSSENIEPLKEDEDNEEEPQQVEPQEAEAKAFNPIDEVDFNENLRTFTEPRTKSKSEANLKTTLPEITERKIINSAPPLNDIVNIVPYSFAPPAEVKIPRTSLPGSILPSADTPRKNHSSPQRLLRRSISVRTPSVKRCHKSAKTSEPRPTSRPKETLNQALSQMESPNWETVIQGLNSLIGVARDHSDILEHQMHPICAVLARNIRNLRSQVARTACHAASEIFASCKKGLDMELEDLATPLLQRTADTNKFLRSDANAALDAMILNLNLPIPRVVAVVFAKGSTHQNGVVRGAATRILSDLALRLGHERVFQLPKETRDKFLLIGANGLTEGSLETRRYAKTLMSTLAGHFQFQKALTDAVPQHTIRHIAKTINSLK